MMISVAPVWDGNEIWLVLGCGVLFAVFLLSNAITMHADHADVAGAYFSRRFIRILLADKSLEGALEHRIVRGVPCLLLSGRGLGHAGAGHRGDWPRLCRGLGAATLVLIGAANLIPIMLDHTTYAYWVLCGKFDLAKRFH